MAKESFGLKPVPDDLGRERGVNSAIETAPPAGEKKNTGEIPEIPESAGVVPEKEAVKRRTPEEIRELRDRLHFIAKVFSKNYGMKMYPGKGWAAGLTQEFTKEREKYPGKSLEEFDEKLLTPEKMTYPEKDLINRSEDYNFGVFRHEMGHIKHSDYLSLMELQENARKEGYRPLDLYAIYDAWEDGRSNNCEAGTSKRARYRLGVYLKEDVAEVLLRNLEKKSLPIQYGVLSWARGAESFIEGFNFDEIRAKIKDERILKAFEDSSAILDEYLAESKGRKAAREILWEKGWPFFKKLIDEQLEDQAKKLHEKEKDEKKEKETGKEKSESEPGKEPGPETPGEEAGNEEPEGGEPEKGKEEQPGAEPETGAPEEGTPDEGAGKDAGEEGESWDDLPEDEKQKYRDRARGELDEEEREIIEILQPGSMGIEEEADGTIEVAVLEPDPEDIAGGEATERKEEEEEKKRRVVVLKEQARQSEAGKKTLSRLKERETGLTERERALYDKYFQPVKKYVGLLSERLDEVFPPSHEAEWQGGYKRGKRIAARKMAREIPIERGEFFERKEVPEIKEAAFSLLIDVSSSMAGEKIQKALQAAILKAESFTRKGVPFEILAFHNELIQLKGFDEKFFGRKKLDILKVLELVQTPNAAWNDDGFAVDGAARRLQKRLLENNAKGALIVFSDGMPVPSAAHDGPEYELSKIVNKWSQQIPLIGVGIGPGMEKTITRYYGKNGLPVPDVNQLPRELLKILERQAARFENKEDAE